MWSAGNKWVELDIPDQLYSVAVDGDWIVNVALPLDRRNKALLSILRSATGRDLLIEQRLVERDVIVARGDWSFVPMAQQPTGQTIWLQFYTDKLDHTRASYSPPANLTNILEWLEGTTNRKVIDEVTQRPAQDVPWMNHTSANDAIDNEQKRGQLLENLHKQTSLEFLRTRRVIPVWFIREQSPATQPKSPK
jgi:hypothetical protein